MDSDPLYTPTPTRSPSPSPNPSPARTSLQFRAPSSLPHRASKSLLRSVSRLASDGSAQLYRLASRASMHTNASDDPAVSSQMKEQSTPPGKRAGKNKREARVLQRPGYWRAREQGRKGDRWRALGCENGTLGDDLHDDGDGSRSESSFDEEVPGAGAGGSGNGSVHTPAANLRAGIQHLAQRTKSSFASVAESLAPYERWMGNIRRSQ